MTKRVGVYCRFSSDKQALTSLDDQLRLCRALAERNGWQVVGVYQDAASSGALRDRKGYMSLVADAISGKFDLVVAESLDRLDRDLEATARLFKQLRFIDVGIVTVSEGPISEIHVSISGLMGEMYLKALSEKTRRGVEGRVLAGMSGGGRCFGYDIVTGVDASGVPVTGVRRVNEVEAEVVHEIFRRFAAGEGPRAIARELNNRNVPGPGGRPWGDTTIRGHSKKGTGLLNNSTYIGLPTWGRQRFIKDPKSGRRVSRLNPVGSEIVTDVPHLRIIQDALWQAVKQRQDEVSRPTSDPHFTNPLNETHRPRFLLSGLLTCGVCGGGYTITAKDRYGCARRGRQGTCSNSRGIKRQELESRVLDGLRTSLVTPDIVASFVYDYRIAWNKLQSERRAEANQRDRKLAEVTRKISSVMDAIERGILTPTTKGRLLALEAEKAEFERMTVEPDMPAIHPNLAKHYRDLVQRLQDQLEQPELAASAKTMLRALIEEIRITPGVKRGECCLELVGKLAAILNISQSAKNKGGTLGTGIQASVVAGAGFEPTTFRL
jgi:site-specific DNA recombinase